MSLKAVLRSNPFRHPCRCTTCSSYITYNASIKRQLAKQGMDQHQITTALKINPRFFLGYVTERVELTGGRIIAALLWWIFVGQKPVTSTLIVKMPQVPVENKAGVPPLCNGRTIRLIDPDSDGS